MTFTLAPLPFSYDALEPYIDAKTMEIHHDKHHAAYTEKFNKALVDNGLDGKSVEEIFASISKYPAAVRNNGGGYYNHNFFWESLAKAGSTQMSEGLKQAIDRDFGSFDKFKEEFSAAALNQFGSGWAWLIEKDGKLIITSSPNQDNPLMDAFSLQGKPLLCLDVWEHAYYLKYQNRRPEYIENFWNVVNWDAVSKRLSA